MPGRWALFTRPPVDDYDRHTVQILINRGEDFQATGKGWTVGRPHLRPQPQGPVITISYASPRRQCRPEKIAARDIASVGRLAMVYQPDQKRWQPV